MVANLLDVLAQVINWTNMAKSPGKHAFNVFNI